MKLYPMFIFAVVLLISNVSTQSENSNTQHKIYSILILDHDYACGPFLSLPTGFIIANNSYTFKARISNLGANNESAVPIDFLINNVLISTAFKSINSGVIDSVANLWTPTSAGVYNLKYICKLATDLDRSNDTVQINLTVYASIPVICEEFSAPVFPPSGWNLVLLGGGTLYWSRDSASGYGLGTGSAKYNMWVAPLNTTQNLVTYTFPQTAAGDSIIFDIAYQPFGTAPDKLVILSSTNGGTIYNYTVATLGYQALTTTSGNPSPFVPTSTQWAHRIFALQTGTNKLLFQGVSGFGDNLYIDSICKTHRTLTGTANNTEEIPTSYSLSQNYPNPFNPSTNISYGLPKAGLVKLVIFDVLGREIKTLVNGYKAAGMYEISFDASGISSGVYFYKVESGDFSSIKKMVLIK